MKNKKIFLVLIFFFSVFGLGFFVSTISASTITADTPIRITPLCIEAGNFWAGAGKYPWNLSGDKIMIFEEQVDYGINATYKGRYPTPSVCNHTGRGTVWADVQTIMADSVAHNYAEAIGTNATDALTALASYKLITHKLPDNWKEQMAEWSQVAGQENIIYGVKDNYSGTYTLEYVDTTECDGSGENCIGHAMICNGESPCTLNCTTAICGSNYNATSEAKLFTWTTDSTPKLVSSMPVGSHNGEYFWDGVLIFDVSTAPINQTAVKSFHSGWHNTGETGWAQFKMFSHGHIAASPDQQAMAYYGNTSYMSCFGDSGSPCNGGYAEINFNGVHEPIENSCKLGTCGTIYADTTGAKDFSSHVSWYGNDDYYFSYEAWGNNIEPHIENHDIWLVEYNRDTNTFTSNQPLLTMRGSASWTMDPKCDWLSGKSVSYGNSPHGSDKRDDKQLYVFGVGGDYYTRTDEYCSGYAVTYGRNNGAWLVNLTKNADPDTTPPSPPSGVSVQ